VCSGEFLSSIWEDRYSERAFGWKWKKIPPLHLMESLLELLAIDKAYSVRHFADVLE
jgi:hypothetical protein